MLFNLKKYSEKIALQTDSYCTSYSDILRDVKKIKKVMGKRNVIYFRSSNTFANIYDFLCYLLADNVIILVDDSCDEEYHKQNIQKFLPNYIYDGSSIKQNQYHPCYTNKELALVLPTSGSTGNPKFVMITKKNIKASTAAIIKATNVESKDKAILALPMHYVYGLSIIFSHLAVGATIYKSPYPYASNKFWTDVVNSNSTSMGLVTSGYEFMFKFHCDKYINTSSIKKLTHSGSFLYKDLYPKIYNLCSCNDIQFYRMYGTTETMSRITVLPYDAYLDNPYAVGKCIVPKSKITIDKITNEIIYCGNNVMLGYADNFADFQKKRTTYIYNTGDTGHFNKDGYLVLTGRLNRISKPGGYRVNLDDVELNLINNLNAPFAVIDIKDTLCVVTPDNSITEQDIMKYIPRYYYQFQLKYHNVIHNNRGKKDYEQMKNLFEI